MASPTMTVDQKNALARAQVNLDVLLANATSAKAQAGRMLRTEGQDYLKLVALAVSLGETLGGLLQTHFHVPVQPSEANLGPNEVALDLANIDARFGLRFGPLPGVAAKSIPQPDYADDSEEAADALIAADDAHVAAMEDPLGARTSGLLAELAALRLAEDVDVTRLRSAISYMAAISGTRFGEQPKFDGALPWSVGPKDTSVSGDIAVPSFTLPWLMACFGNGLALFSDGHFHAAALALDSVLLLLRALIFPDLSLLSLNAEQMPMVDLLRGLTDPVKRRQASVWLEAVLYLRIFALWADTDLAGALSACRDYLSLMHWVSFGSPTSDNSIQCGHAFTLFEENQIGEYPWLYNVPQLDRPLEGTFPQGKFLIPATDPRRLVSVLALFTQLLALSQERGSSDPLPLYAMCLAHALPWLQYISLDFESRHDMWPLSVEQALGILEAGLQLAGPILGLDLMQDFGTAPGCLAPLVTQVALERLQHTGRHSLAEESLQTMTLLAGLRTRTVLSRAAYMSGGSAELRQQADNCRLFFALALLRSNYPLASANELKSAGLLQMELGTSSADQPLTLGSEDSWCSLLQAHILSAALRTAALVHLAQVDAEADAVRLGPATLPPLVPSDPATAEPQYYLATAAGLALGAFHALTRALGRLAPGDAAPAAGRVDLALLRASLAHGAAVCQLHLARGADPAVRLAALALGHRVVATPGDDLPYGGPARQALLASVADLLEEVLPAEIADADQLETVNLADRDGNWLFVIASSLYHLGLAHSEKRDVRCPVARWADLGTWDPVTHAYMSPFCLAHEWQMLT
ncbi:hypothetical protein, variant [Fonticula alba]|uniref:Uncharacterized protein n=1 Tax=Fonticula alba TaxID=691883 RepID=A0A058ZG20_FONAL|nr:hypothetical protein, variant [Fonticula alba]KCV72873.1 hypothetical protein, variant [Fonticula alba]|eukprot:XP_009492574.1 hypothetical protein, variant [Fonticula alba]